MTESANDSVDGENIDCGGQVLVEVVIWVLMMTVSCVNNYYYYYYI